MSSSASSFRSWSGLLGKWLGCGLLGCTATLDASPAANTSQPAMLLRVLAGRIEFASSDGRVAGHYHFADPFKPYVHPLVSPAGHVVSLAAPHDHPHHKGLMYALRIPELNFWEERSTRAGEGVGRQRHVAFSERREAGEEVGFTEILAWEPAAGGEAVFAETRRVSCRRDGAAFHWTWATTLTAHRAVTLTQSQWSHRMPDGRRINYHGLGLRLRREFGGGTRNNALQLDDGEMRWNKGGTPFDFTDAMGAKPDRVTFIGSVDGVWPTPRVAVTFEQRQKNGLFVMETPFAFLSLGPSNLGERALAAGETLTEHYLVTVADR